MSKNYPAIYASNNDSIALEQRFYVKEETTRGVMVYPQVSDFIKHLPGGSITFEQPFESSPQRSGRHHTNIIVKKKVSSFTFSNYFNIDEGAIDGVNSIDIGMRVLWKSLLGFEDATGTDLIYNSTIDPNTTFTLVEAGDKWARQTPGCFILGGNIQLVGDGEATCEWSGNGKTTFLAGIAQSTVANSTDFTVAAGEGKRFTPGAAVMIVKDDNTRSSDTPVTAPLIIDEVNGDVITFVGSPTLLDADGSGTPIYLVYHEPSVAGESEVPAAIDNPIEGLTGSVSIAGLSSQCVRSLGMNAQNNHELVDYCFGEDGLAGALFVPGDRLTVELSLSMNLNADVLGFFAGLLQFPTEQIQAILGDSTGRHVQFDIPAARFQVPGFSVPDTGSIPIEFSGQAYQLNNPGDEFQVTFK